jgi:hypothetical protein
MRSPGNAQILEKLGVWCYGGAQQHIAKNGEERSIVAAHREYRAQLVSPRSDLCTAHKNGDRQAMAEHNSETDQCSDRSNDVDGDNEI